MNTIVNKSELPISKNTFLIADIYTLSINKIIFAIQNAVFGYQKCSFDLNQLPPTKFKYLVNKQIVLSIYPYKPSVLFVGHMQTVQMLI